MDIITGNREICIWIKKLQTPIDMFGFNNVASKITEYGYIPQFGLSLICDGLRGTIISFSTVRERNMLWFYDNATNTHTLTTSDGHKICTFDLHNRLYRCDFSTISLHPHERAHIRQYYALSEGRIQIPSLIFPHLAEPACTNTSPVSAHNPSTPITRVLEQHINGKLEWYSELLQSGRINQHTILVVVRVVQATA